MSDSASFRIRRLEPGDDRSGFDCGDIELDRFFQRYAGQNQFRHHIGTTYVAMTDERIAGYATVSVGEITGDRIAPMIRRRLPTYPLPILRIARLAVDRRCQGCGVGRQLLRGMLVLALELRDKVGCVGIVVDAKPAAVEFYTTLGFEPLDVGAGALGQRPEPVPMFLPIRIVAQAAGE